MEQAYMVGASGYKKDQEGHITFKFINAFVSTENGEDAAKAYGRGAFIKQYPNYEVLSIVASDITKTVREFIDENPRVH